MTTDVLRQGALARSPAHSWRPALLFVGLVLWFAMPSVALADEVIAQYPGIPATFTEGNAADFTVTYDVRIIRLADGSTAAVFNQRGSSDLLGGPINSDGIPRYLLNPGLERMRGGRMVDDRTLVYNFYQYNFPNGQKGVWKRVELNFPEGALPFPLPADAETQEEASPSPSPSPSASPESVDSPDPSPASATDAGGGAPTGVIVAIVVGGVAAGGLVTMARRKKRTCDEEKEAWENATRLHEEAVDAESDASHEKQLRQMAYDHAVAARSVAEAKVFMDTPSDGSQYDEAKSQWDAMKPEWDAEVAEAKAELEEAEANHETATARRKELETAREEAKQRYEACVGQATAEAAGTTSTATTSSGSGVAATPKGLGPTQTRTCKDSDPPRNERYFGRDSVELVIDFQVRATPTGSARGHYQDAEELAASLTEIAEMLEDLGEGKLPGKAGELQELRDQAKSLADKAKTLKEKGAGELLKGEIQDAIKEQVDKVNAELKDALNTATGLGDAMDAATKVPDLLKEPYKIPIEILKMTAELGALVALFAGKVVSENDMYLVEARVQTLQIDILWRSIERCVNGRWTKEYQVITANGPTKWQDPWHRIGEYPGRATGRGLDEGLNRAMNWCQLKMNTSSERLSQAINTPPKGR